MKTQTTLKIRCSAPIVTDGDTSYRIIEIEQLMPAFKFEDGTAQAGDHCGSIIEVPATVAVDQYSAVKWALDQELGESPISAQVEATRFMLNQYSLTEVGDASGVSRATISLFRRGANIGLDNFVAICEALQRLEKKPSAELGKGGRGTAEQDDTAAEEVQA